MTQQPELPEPSGPPPSAPPPAGPPQYPYAYPPGHPGAQVPPGPYQGAYPPPPLPYGGEYYPGAPVPAPRNGLGVAALVLAILALVASCSVVGGLILGIAAVILGFLARGRVTRGEANNGGIALTGIILGSLAVVISLAFIAMYVGIFNNYGGREMITCVQEAGGDNTKVQECMDAFQQQVEEQTGQGGRPGR